MKLQLQVLHHQHVVHEQETDSQTDDQWEQAYEAGSQPDYLCMRLRACELVFSCKRPVGHPSGLQLA